MRSQERSEKSIMLNLKIIQVLFIILIIAELFSWFTLRTVFLGKVVWSAMHLCALGWEVFLFFSIRGYFGEATIPWLFVALTRIIGFLVMVLFLNLKVNLIIFIFVFALEILYCVICLIDKSNYMYIEEDE